MRMGRGRGMGLMSRKWIEQLEKEDKAAKQIARSLTPERVRKYIKSAKSRKEVEKIASKALLALAKKSKSRKRRVSKKGKSKGSKRK